MAILQDKKRAARWFTPEYVAFVATNWPVLHV